MPKAAAKRRARRKAAPPKHPHTCTGTDGFGAVPKAQHMMYNGNSSTGAVTTKHELGIVVNDYFDYNALGTAQAGNVPQFVSHYWWNNGQNLFNTDPTVPAGIDQTFCRVRKLEVWVLPQARGLRVPPVGLIQDVSNAEAMYTVSCQVPGTTFQPTGQTGAEAFAANTQVTNVLPQFDTKWKKVLTCDLQRTFQSSVMSPVFSPFVPGTTTRYTNQCLFSMSVLNPTDGKAYLTGNVDDPEPSIRVRVQITLDQPIQTSNAAQLRVFRNEDFSEPYLGQNDIDFPGTVAQYVQADLRSVRDNFR